MKNTKFGYKKIGYGKMCNSDNLFKELVRIIKDMISKDQLQEIKGSSVNISGIDDLANKFIYTLTICKGDEINNRSFNRIDSDVSLYYSIDKNVADDENKVSEYNDEYINSLGLS